MRTLKPLLLALSLLTTGGGAATPREQWQLVRTEQGWKIFSVIYTIRAPAPPVSP